MMFDHKTKAGLMALAAGYLLYTAYNLFQARNDPESTMSLALVILFVVFFVCTGIGVLIYAYRLWKKPDTSTENEKSENEENRLK